MILLVQTNLLDEIYISFIWNGNTFSIHFIFVQLLHGIYDLALEESRLKNKEVSQKYLQKRYDININMRYILVLIFLNVNTVLHVKLCNIGVLSLDVIKV